MVALHIVFHHVGIAAEHFTAKGVEAFDFYAGGVVGDQKGGHAFLVGGVVVGFTVQDDAVVGIGGVEKTL